MTATTVVWPEKAEFKARHYPDYTNPFTVVELAPCHRLMFSDDHTKSMPATGAQFFSLAEFVQALMAHVPLPTEAYRQWRRDAL